MGEGGCVCVVGEKKKERQGYMGGGEKKKEIGSGVYVYSGKKRGSGKERRKKNLKEKKLKWFYLYVHFVWCKV
jgi:Uri superfamily endonuclease